jgi:hypothetical protein
LSFNAFLRQSFRERGVCIDEGRSEVPSVFAAAVFGGEGGICAGAGAGTKNAWIRHINNNTTISVFRNISFMFITCFCVRFIINVFFSIFEEKAYGRIPQTNEFTAFIEKTS